MGREDKVGSLESILQDKSSKQQWIDSWKFGNSDAASAIEEILAASSAAEELRKKKLSSRSCNDNDDRAVCLDPALNP